MSTTKPWPPAAVGATNGHAYSANLIGGSTVALWRVTGLVLAAWLAVSGVLLAVRTALHATRPLGWQQLVLATLGLLATAWMSHGAVTLPRTKRGGVRAALVCGVLTTVGLLLWSISLTHGTGSYVAATAIYLSLIAEEAWAWRSILVSGRHPKHRGLQRSTTEARIVQQFTRSLTADGLEVIQGQMAVRVERGSRMAAGHIAFCPPLIERPQFEAQLLEPSRGTLKVTQLYAHGVRIEVRLPHAIDANLSLLVRFTARSAQPFSNSSVAHKLGSSR